ncbi:hypothetical protein [Aurantiacibacter sediminis]|uniref:Uncharacterized protein n=1 Tax=Aurantiacibacter sediminis TaxID=2793064 RepID=A0ABS0N0W4_9SPHN|nr:hypothetical protein [Aurantiacibacter sediminis]MBH5321606.1 hypothetical protein [Aurantiacibacter sediminis]
MTEATTPLQRLDVLIDKQGATLAAIGREALRAVVKAMPTANRIVDESDGLLRIHHTPGMSLDHTIVTVSFHGYWVTYDFPQGDRMIDYDELLRRASKGMYHYVIEGPGDVKDREVEWLLNEAADRADPPPNPENHSRLFFIEDLIAKRPDA